MASAYLNVIPGTWKKSQLIKSLTPRGNQHVTSPDNIH